VAAATSLTVTALTAPLAATADDPVYLMFVDAANNTEKLVQVTANAAVGATSLTVAALDAAIANASTAIYPVKLAARTAANLNPNANDIETTTFDDDGYSDGVVTKLGYSISCPGNYLPTDAGYLTCIDAFNNFKEVFLTLELPKPTGYAKGFIFKGFAAVTNAPLDTPAEGIVQANLEFKFRGKPIITKPSLT
jgi:hypothetical protein